MKWIAALIIAAALIPPALSRQTSQKPGAGGGQNRVVILQSDGGSFLIEGPQDWIADRKVGRRLSVCCVFYPKGAWDAETIIYPNIVTKGPGKKTLAELMASDLARFRADNPGMSYTDGGDIFLKDARVAKLRYFHGVNDGSSELVAYIDEQKIIALVVVSSKSEKGLNDSLPSLRAVLQTYTYGVQATNVKALRSPSPPGH